MGHGRRRAGTHKCYYPWWHWASLEELFHCPVSTIRLMPQSSIWVFGQPTLFPTNGSIGQTTPTILRITHIDVKSVGGVVHSGDRFHIPLGQNRDFPLVPDDPDAIFPDHPVQPFTWSHFEGLDFSRQLGCDYKGNRRFAVKGRTSSTSMP
jgi:hypothetical protein